MFFLKIKSEFNHLINTIATIGEATTSIQKLPSKIMDCNPIEHLNSHANFENLHGCLIKYLITAYEV